MPVLENSSEYQYNVICTLSAYLINSIYRVMMGTDTVKFVDSILSKTTFYCRNGGMSGCVQMPVNTTNITDTDCCSHLNLTGNGTESECTISLGK